MSKRYYWEIHWNDTGEITIREGLSTLHGAQHSADCYAHKQLACKAHIGEYSTQIGIKMLPRVEDYISVG